MTSKEKINSVKKIYIFFFYLGQTWLLLVRMTLTQDLSTPVLHDLQSEKKSFVKLFTNLTDCGRLNIEAGWGWGGGEMLL